MEEDKMNMFYRFIFLMVAGICDRSVFIIIIIFSPISFFVFLWYVIQSVFIWLMINWWFLAPSTVNLKSMHSLCIPTSFKLRIVSSNDGIFITSSFEPLRSLHTFLRSFKKPFLTSDHWVHSHTRVLDDVSFNLFKSIVYSGFVSCIPFCCTAYRPTYETW